MDDFVIPKQFVKLTEDHMYQKTCLYEDENCFFPAGSEGVIIDCHTIGLIPNLSDREYSSILMRELMAKDQGAWLVLIDGRLVTISSLKLEIVRHEPPLPIFEDDEDREQYLDEMFEGMKQRAPEDKKNAST